MQQSTLATPQFPEGEEPFGDDLDFGDPADETRVPGEDPDMSG